MSVLTLDTFKKAQEQIASAPPVLLRYENARLRGGKKIRATGKTVGCFFDIEVQTSPMVPDNVLVVMVGDEIRHIITLDEEDGRQES